MSELANKRITVAGLGHFGGGIEVSRWLVGQGARVLVTDKEKPEKLADSVQKLKGLPIEFRLGEHRVEDFTNCDLVVTSPAIPPTNQYLVAAKQAGVPISTEIRLFIERCRARILGVTGTKGKSTTTTLLGLMLKSRHTTWVGGNIGGSLLEKLPEIQPRDLVVLELSSYMLEYMRSMQWSPYIAVVTMITRDHVEWHGGLEGYIDAKRTLVRFQKAPMVAVLNEEDPVSAGFSRDTGGLVVMYGTRGWKPFALKLTGEHNQTNAQAAFAAANVMRVTWDEAQHAIADFDGLPHRLHLVHEAGGVKYYDDSIATVPEAAIAALKAFPDRRVIQIVGGYDKHLPMDELYKALQEHAKAVLCIGATGPAIAAAMAKDSDRICLCNTLETAMHAAAGLAKPGDIVLLSTGFASYDQFINFEARGEAFTKLARSAGTGD